MANRYDFRRGNVSCTVVSDGDVFEAIGDAIDTLAGMEDAMNDELDRRFMRKSPILSRHFKLANDPPYLGEDIKKL